MKKKRFSRLALTIIISIVLHGCHWFNSESLEVVKRNPVPHLEQEYAKFRSRQISDVGYRLFFDVTKTEKFFSGSAEIEFTLSDHNKSPITIDFNGGTIISVELNGQPIVWESGEWYLTFSADIFPKGKNFLRIAYEHPYATSPAGLYRFQDQQTGRVYLYSNLEPFNANKVFPHFDQPDIKASYHLRVVAPKDWHVISATREIDIQPREDANLWTFSPTSKISSYAFPLHAGPYQVWEDNSGTYPLRLFARVEQAKNVNVEEWFLLTQQALAFYSGYFQINYPFKKYDQVIVPDLTSGGMENVAASTFDEYWLAPASYLFRMRRGNVISHELAHMWFGNLVTMEWWNGLWLNESFATYMATLQQFTNSEFGSDALDYFNSDARQWAYDADEQVIARPIDLPVANTEEALTIFDGTTYAKGAAVLYQLSKYIGEQAFRDGTINYLKKHSFNNAGFEEFVEELNLSSNIDLSSWAQEWLLAAGVNTIKTNYKCSDKNGGYKIIKHFDLVQEYSQPFSTLRHQYVRIGLYYKNGDQLTLNKTLDVVYNGGRTNIPEADGLPCPAFVYPNEEDFGYVKIAFDKHSSEFLKNNLKKFPDKLRTKLWKNLWEEVKEGRLAMSEYLDVVDFNLSAEENPRQIRMILSDLQSASSYLWMMGAYSAGHKGTLARLEYLVHKQFIRFESSPAIQKIMLGAYVSVVHTDEALNQLRGLLVDSTGGLELDANLRWAILMRLNQFAFNDYIELTNNESLRDKSNTGGQMALLCEAGRPDRNIKHKWLNEILDPNSSYKPILLSKMTRALFPASQKALFSEYQNRVINSLPALLARNDDFLLANYTSNLMPRSCSEASVSQLMGINKQYGELSPVLYKNLAISIQDDKRCLTMARKMNFKYATGE